MRKTIWTIVIIVILILVGWLISATGQDANNIDNEETATTTDDILDGSTPTDNETAAEPDSTAEGEDEPAAEDAENVIVTYTDNGFSPNELAVSLGTTVMFINESSGGMWVGADLHPTHTEYSGTTLSEHCPDDDGNDFDQCQIGDEFSFTFNQSGTWEYHNHRRANHTGTIVVQ